MTAANASNVLTARTDNMRNETTPCLAWVTPTDLSGELGCCSADIAILRARSGIAPGACRRLFEADLPSFGCGAITASARNGSFPEAFPIGPLICRSASRQLPPDRWSIPNTRTAVGVPTTFFSNLRADDGNSVRRQGL
jgi:hypothetical protein